MLADIVLGDVFAGFMLGIGLGFLIIGSLYGMMFSRLNKTVSDLIDLIKRTCATPDPDARPDDDDDLWSKLGMHDLDE